MSGSEKAKTSLGVTRQPILNRYSRLFAYELRFRGPGSEQIKQSGIGKNQLNKLRGDRPVFLRIPEELLDQNFAGLFPQAQVILDFQVEGEVTEAIRARLQEARQQGFQVALTLTGNPGLDGPIQPWPDYLRIETDTLSEDALNKLVVAARKTSTRLIAGNVATQEAFQQLVRMGFSYFHGQFFTRPVKISRERLPVNKANLLNLYRLIQDDAETEQIEAQFKQSPDLSFRLLTLINSAAFAARKRIESIRQALVLLGRRNIRKWVAMLLYAGDASEFRSPLLAEAVIRGRIMELASKRLWDRQGFSDQAHITGTLSVVDALLNRPMDQIIEDLQLEDEVASALVSREGALGALLKVVENQRQWGTLPAPANLDPPLALAPDDLLFYEQQATLEQATLELEGLESEE